MITVAGVFTDRVRAEQAFRELHILGIEDGNLDLLIPGADAGQLAEVHTADTEQPGMGKAVGSVVGGAVGVGAGLSLGTAAAASLLVPGIGAVLAFGALGAALLGAAGVVGGGKIGDNMDHAMLDGVPKDEVFIYEDALRHGRCVVIALARDESERDETRRILEREGAESIDAARHKWWTGIRDDERQHYAATGGHFETDEEMYRRGFEAALNPEFRGRPWEQVSYVLVERYPDWAGDCFRKGFERGQRHYRSLAEHHPTGVR